MATSTTFQTQMLKPKKQRGPFASLAEQLLAVRRAAIAARTTGTIDPRLVELQRRAQAAGGSEAVPADGSFLIQPEFSRKIMKRLYRNGDVFTRCTELPITAPNSNAIRFPQFSEDSRANGSRLGGVAVAWENEADTLIASKPQFQLTELTAHKLIGLVYATNEQVADSNALEAWAKYAFSSELLFVLEESILNGSGTGQCQGILNSPALVTIAKESTQGSGTVVSANVTKMTAALWAGSYQSDSTCWLYNQALLPQLAALQLSVGTGGSEARLWNWATSSDDWDMLSGFPALPSEHCAVPGTVGDLLLVDLNRYVLAMRQGLRSDVSIHLRWLTDESAFRFVLRANGQTVDRSPITPLHGTAQTSSFIALAAR